MAVCLGTQGLLLAYTEALLEQWLSNLPCASQNQLEGSFQQALLGSTSRRSASGPGEWIVCISHKFSGDAPFVWGQDFENLCSRATGREALEEAIVSPAIRRTCFLVAGSHHLSR